VFWIRDVLSQIQIVPSMAFKTLIKNKVLKTIFLLDVCVHEGKFTFISKDNSFSLGSHKTLEIIVFLINFLLVDEKIRIRTNNY
jgi:hypothetical protein